MDNTCRLFNAGNTHVQIADVSGAADPEIIATVPTHSFDPREWRTENMAAASVVPGLDDMLRDCGAFLLDCSTIPERLVSLEGMENSETIGADRLANAAALVSSGDLPALCVDLGTAITFEFVDESHSLLGGAIMPGRMLMRRALNAYTAKLPLTDIRNAVTPVPGANTCDAINIGADTGAVGAVREILSRFNEKYGGSLRVVFCGGDAAFFAPFFPDAEDGGHDFTLRGLAEICRVTGRIKQ